jgi:cytoskeletal protein RodZ
MQTNPTAEHDRVAFGEFLRQARERRRLTLEQIAGETKIAPRHLTSLEQGNVHTMPKGMYRRAMLRAYAESVGLDTKAALSEFERTFEEPPPREAPPPPVAGPVRVQQAPPRTTVVPRRGRLTGIALGFVVLVGLGVWVLSSADDEELRVVDQTPFTAPAPAASVSAPVNPAPAREEAATSGTAAPAATVPAAAPFADTERPLATEGQLTIVSEPPGARVTVNGVGWGSTPLTIRYLPLGQKRVRVTKDGYISQERTMSVDGRRPSATLRVTLQERP